MELGFSTYNIRNKWKSPEVYDYLASMGVPEKSVASIDADSSTPEKELADDILDAGDVFRRHGFHNFSGTDISLLLFADEWSPDKAAFLIRKSRNAMHRTWHQDSKERSRVFYPGGKVSSYPCVSPVQLVREMTGNYFGNLYEARQVWDDFMPSETDFRESRKIPFGAKPNPENLDNAAFLLGVIYGTGYLARKGINGTRPHRLFIKAGKDDEKFLVDVVSKHLKEIFNVNSHVKLECRRTLNAQKMHDPESYGFNGYSADLTRDPDETYMLPAFDISSQAIATWLEDDLGFPRHNTGKKHTMFPLRYFTRKGHEKFLEGIVAATGCLTNGRLIIVDKDPEYILQLKGLMISLGIRNVCSYEDLYAGTKSKYVHLSDEGTQNLLKFVDLVNPKHNHKKPKHH